MQNSMGQLELSFVVENAGLQTIVKKSEAKALNLSKYFTGVACKHGHLSERLVSNGTCCECSKVYLAINKEKISTKKKAYYKDNKDMYSNKSIIYYEANKEKITARAKAYFKDNKEVIAAKKKIYNEANKDKIYAVKRAYQLANKDQAAEYQKLWREGNKDKMSEYKKAYYQDNKDKIADYKKSYGLTNRDRIKAYAKERSKKPHVKAAITCRSLLHRSLRLTNTSKKGSTFDMLGYTAKELRNYIEAQFIDGMSWENHAHDTWHVDHIKPVSLFIKEGITDPKIINALSNLQPLWAEDNLSKGANYE